MGMGIELPIWVITSKSKSKFFNLKSNRFDKDVSESCLFYSPIEAERQLSLLDYGYVLKKGRYYKDAKENRIQLNS